MSMLSFYGGPAGKDFRIAKVFQNKVELDADLAATSSDIHAGDYVLISYGDPNTESFSTNLAKDANAYSKNYNATIWKKDWDNGYIYENIVSIAGSYPYFTTESVEASLPFGSTPQLEVDSSSLANPKLKLIMPATLVAGSNNSAESVSPTTAPTVTSVYGGSKGNELSFALKIPRGVTFTPTVSDAGEISWSNDGNLSNPTTKSIKGQKGDTGTSFAGIEYTPSSASGGSNTFKVKYSDGSVGTQSYTIKNGVDIVNVKADASTADGGENKVTFIKSDNSEVGPISIFNGNKGSTGTIKSISATVDDQVGTPAVTATLSGDASNADIAFAFKNLKGNRGEQGIPATIEFTSITVDDASVEDGKPSVTVNSSTSESTPWDAKYSLAFHNLVGKIGARGLRGYHYTPAVSADGDLSWTNDGDLANPVTVNIRGPQGEVGAPLNIIANLTVSAADVSENTTATVGSYLTNQGINPIAGQLVAVTYQKSADDFSAYWYFKVNGQWQRVQLTGGMGGAIVNEKITDATADAKVYSAEYVNNLEARIAVLENALTIGQISDIVKGGI